MSAFDLDNAARVDGQAIARMELFDHFNKKYRFYCDRTDPDITLYVWEERIWVRHSEATILRELANYYGTIKPQVTKDGILEYYKGAGQNTLVAPKPPHIIAFNNGILDLNEGKFLPHDSKYFIVNVIPHDFDVKAQCPEWEKFLIEVHRVEDILFIQEFYGYMLYSAYPRALFLLLIGSGQNGKSIELETVSHVIGSQNISNASIQDLNYNEYTPAQLHQKLANIADDITNQTLAVTGKLKTLSSGGFIQARHIRGSPFDFENYAKIVNSCNEPPIIKEDTDALWERLKVVEYPNKFVSNPDPAKGEKPSKDKYALKKTLEAEAPGIINWMLKGLARLLENGFKFSYNRSTEEVRAYYRRVSNPIVIFREECMEYTGNDEDLFMKDDLYPAFQAWCKEKKIKPIPTRDKFFKSLANDGIEAVRRRELNRERAYVGWKLDQTYVSMIQCPNVPTTFHTLFEKSSENSVVESENTEVRGGQGRDIGTADSETPRDSLLDRLEEYSRVSGEVGYLKACSDLGLTEEQLRGIMSSHNCRVSWSTSGQTIRWNGEGGG